ncbi:hypothetical protein GCM10023080_046320 [Streptomyces pseudoechinosporeus]
MHSRGRTLKFTAALSLVVLALTGFSTGRHGHGGGSGGSGGGGCSSSSQDHGSSSSTTSGGSYGSGSDDDSDDSYDDSYDDSGSTSTSGGGSSTRRPGYRSTPTPSSTGTSSAELEDGTAKLVSCATATTPYATVEVTNPNKREAEFQVWVTFYDAEGTLLLSNNSPVVTVPAKGKATTQVTLGKRFLASVDHCEADPEAEVRD